MRKKYFTKDRWKTWIKKGYYILIKIDYIIKNYAIIALTVLMVIAYNYQNNALEKQYTSFEKQSNTLEKEFLAKRDRSTITLCKEFDNWYLMYDYDIKYRHPKELDFLHLWLHAKDTLRENWEISDSIKDMWEKMAIKEKEKLLLKNEELRRLLNLFENAKMSNEAEPPYLDKAYFYNFFCTTVDRLIKVQDPTFDTYLRQLREFNSKDTTCERPFIFDGFDYCLKEIFIPLSQNDKGRLNTLKDYYDTVITKYDIARKKKERK
ncbi:MAG: hypothetical protein LBR17_07520 [Bacteroidales bacterium]|jgi:hypothetical protein|nr:hypothetical protein [Bacteroidales bacterium]